jgi:hypothetical protein
MGAVDHLKTLCCLGLPPESAMIAEIPLLLQIIPHGWSRMGYAKICGEPDEPRQHHSLLWLLRPDCNSVLPSPGSTYPIST